MAGAVELGHIVVQNLSLFPYWVDAFSNNCLTAVKSGEKSEY